MIRVLIGTDSDHNLVPMRMIQLCKSRFFYSPGIMLSRYNYSITTNTKLVDPRPSNES